MILSTKVYNTLKYIARYIFPAVGALYLALANIWGLPYGEQVCGTLTALTVALNTLLGISSKNFYKETGDGDGDA